MKTKASSSCPAAFLVPSVDPLCASGSKRGFAKLSPAHALLNVQQPSIPATPLQKTPVSKTKGRLCCKQPLQRTKLQKQQIKLEAQTIAPVPLEKTQPHVTRLKPLPSVSMHVHAPTKPIPRMPAVSLEPEMKLHPEDLNAAKRKERYFPASKPSVAHLGHAAVPMPLVPEGRFSLSKQHTNYRPVVAKQKPVRQRKSHLVKKDVSVQS